MMNYTFSIFFGCDEMNEYNTLVTALIFLFTEKARKRQQLANWFRFIIRFIMRRPFHGALIVACLFLLATVTQNHQIVTTRVYHEVAS